MTTTFDARAAAAFLAENHARRASYANLPPDIALEAQALHRRQSLTDLLVNQSMEPLAPPEVKGRFQGAVHPLQGIAKLLQAYLGARGRTESEQGYAALGQKYAAGETADREKIQAALMAQHPGTPEIASEHGKLPAKIKRSCP